MLSLILTSVAAPLLIIISLVTLTPRHLSKAWAQFRTSSAQLNIRASMASGLLRRGVAVKLGPAWSTPFELSASIHAFWDGTTTSRERPVPRFRVLSPESPTESIECLDYLRDLSVLLDETLKDPGYDLSGEKRETLAFTPRISADFIRLLPRPAADEEVDNEKQLLENRPGERLVWNGLWRQSEMDPIFRTTKGDQVHGLTRMAHAVATGKIAVGSTPYYNWMVGLSSLLHANLPANSLSGGLDGSSVILVTSCSTDRPLHNLGRAMEESAVSCAVIFRPSSQEGPDQFHLDTDHPIEMVEGKPVFSVIPPNALHGSRPLALIRILPSLLLHGDGKCLITNANIRNTEAVKSTLSALSLGVSLASNCDPSLASICLSALGINARAAAELRPRMPGVISLCPHVYGVDEIIFTGMLSLRWSNRSRRFATLHQGPNPKIYVNSVSLHHTRDNVTNPPRWIRNEGVKDATSHVPYVDTHVSALVEPSHDHLVAVTRSDFSQHVDSLGYDDPFVGGIPNGSRIRYTDRPLDVIPRFVQPDDEEIEMGDDGWLQYGTGPGGMYRPKETCYGLRSPLNSGPYGWEHYKEQDWLARRDSKKDAEVELLLETVSARLNEFTRDLRPPLPFKVTAASAEYLDGALGDASEAYNDRWHPMRTIIFTPQERSYHSSKAAIDDVTVGLLDGRSDVIICRVPLVNNSLRSLMYYRMIPSVMGDPRYTYIICNARDPLRPPGQIKWLAFEIGMRPFSYAHYGPNPVMNAWHQSPGAWYNAAKSSFIALFSRFSWAYGPDEMWYYQFVPSVIHSREINCVCIGRNQFVDLPYDVAFIDESRPLGISSWTRVSNSSRKTAVMVCETARKKNLAGLCPEYRLASDPSKDEIARALTEYPELRYPESEAKSLPEAQLAFVPGDVPLYGPDETPDMDLLKKTLIPLGRATQALHGPRWPCPNPDEVIQLWLWGSHGDHIPTIAYARFLSALGQPVILREAATLDEGRRALHAAEASRSLDVLPLVAAAWTRVNSSEGLHFAPLSVAGPRVKTVSLAPHASSSRPINPGTSVAIIDFLARMKYVATANDLRIGSFFGMNVVPRSADGRRFLSDERHSSITGRWGRSAERREVYTLGSSAEHPPPGFIPSTASPLPAGDHQELLRGVTDLYCPGGEGLVATARSRGVTVHTWSTALDRQRFNSQLWFSLIAEHYGDEVTALLACQTSTLVKIYLAIFVHLRPLWLVNSLFADLCDFSIVWANYERATVLLMGFYTIYSMCVELALPLIHNPVAMLYALLFGTSGIGYFIFISNAITAALAVIYICQRDDSEPLMFGGLNPRSLLALVMTEIDTTALVTALMTTRAVVPAILLSQGYAICRRHVVHWGSAISYQLITLAAANSGWEPIRGRAIEAVFFMRGWLPVLHFDLIDLTRGLRLEGGTFTGEKVGIGAPWSYKVVPYMGTSTDTIFSFRIPIGMSAKLFDACEGQTTTQYGFGNNCLTRSLEYAAYVPTTFLPLAVIFGWILASLHLFFFFIGSIIIVLVSSNFTHLIHQYRALKYAVAALQNLNIS